MGSGRSWSLLRTTQFHEFAAQTLHRGSVAGLHTVPAMRCQPIAAAEVAATLISIAAGDPLAVAPDLAGPRIEDMPDLLRRYLRARGARGVVLGVPLPGALGHAMRAGGLLPGPTARLGTQTFDEWLSADTPPPPPPGRVDHDR
jgi:hypothetical protein